MNRCVARGRGPRATRGLFRPTLSLVGKGGRAPGGGAYRPLLKMHVRLARCSLLAWLAAHAARSLPLLCVISAACALCERQVCCSLCERQVLCSVRASLRAWSRRLPQVIDGNTGAALPAQLPSLGSPLAAMATFLRLSVAARDAGTLPQTMSQLMVEAIERMQATIPGSSAATYRPLKAALREPAYTLARRMLSQVSCPVRVLAAAQPRVGFGDL